ncbi:MAG: sel1 repeat family protein [Candidatus Obscuribacterales bacterium]|nr:sel1 repeat family protein [Candidatus Obscuribacterales bacterium]
MQFGHLAAPLAVSAAEVTEAHEEKFQSACEHLRNKHYREAHATLRELARHNHAKSLTVMGLLYERGLGVQQDFEKAFDCYWKAANKGLPEAESRMGHLVLHHGHKLKDKSQRPDEWLLKAAQHGVAEAQHTLGKLYYEGNHLPLNHSEAVRWLRQAADQGHVEAQEMLSKVPALKQVNEHFAQAGSQYGTSLTTVQKSWVGYADVVNSINSAAAYDPSKK